MSAIYPVIVPSFGSGLAIGWVVELGLGVFSVSIDAVDVRSFVSGNDDDGDSRHVSCK